jgi:hypothetical protein
MSDEENKIRIQPEDDENTNGFSTSLIDDSSKLDHDEEGEGDRVDEDVDEDDEGDIDSSEEEEDDDDEEEIAKV